jgi:hypothetical protein
VPDINPTLEIFSAQEADIVKGDTRWKLKGGRAAAIIWAYRHCLEHPDTGERDAALYLWGLTNGLHHAAVVQAEETLERLQNRRLDQPD